MVESSKVIWWLLATLTFIHHLRNHDWRQSIGGSEGCGRLLQDLHGKIGCRYCQRICVGMFEGGLEGLPYTGSTKEETGCYPGAHRPTWVGWGEGTSQGNLEVAVTKK